jgi:hypothetical protein
MGKKQGRAGGQSYNVSSIFNELKSGIDPDKVLFPSQLLETRDHQSRNSCTIFH